MKTIPHCLECGKALSQGVNEFSLLVYGHSLCVTHQDFITSSGASPQMVDLYFALKARRIPVALEYFEGPELVHSGRSIACELAYSLTAVQLQ